MMALKLSPRSQILRLVIAPALLVLFSALAPCSAQGPVINRSRGREMLDNIKGALKERYYDPNFRGMDIDARFKEASKQIDAATSTWQINAIIAEVLLELDDSHTGFLPPDLVLGASYGFRMQMIGDVCYVVGVKPKSDAEAKGLRVGDIIHSVENFAPTRDSLWKLNYSYFVLLQPPTLNIVMKDSTGQLRQLPITAEVKKKKPNKVVIYDTQTSEKPPKYHELSPSIIICKLPEFELGDKGVDEMMNRIGRHDTLILDLRGNPGGLVKMVERLLGYFFDHDVKISDEKQRGRTTVSIAKTRGDKTFKGKLIVLVDSKSTSAAEVFARVVQLEKRGVVIGDRSGGMVMTSIRAGFAFRGADSATFASAQNRPRHFYGASITTADVIMADGKSLERIGVTPDETVRPTGSDLAAGRDPALAYAASIAGVKLDATAAGAIFPPEPYKDDDEDDAKDKKNKQ